MTEVYALDLDEELLSHLADPESFAALWAEDLDPDHIVDDEVRDIYVWQCEHQRKYKKPATAAVLADEFDLELREPETVIGDLIERLTERWLRNNVRGEMEKVSDAYKEDPLKAVEVMSDVSRELQRKVGKRGEAFGTGDFERAMHRYDESVLRGPGPSFGFEMVDSHFYGLRGVTFGLAPPKTYKSWIYSTNTAVENIMDGKHVWVYTLELPAEEADMRLRCLAADIPFWRYLRNSISPQDRARLQEASELLDGLGTYRCVKPEEGHRSIEEMVERAGDAGADFVIIDQLQYVETKAGMPLGGAKPQEYWQPLNRARDLSDEMPMMIVHQFNRSVMNADKMPSMQQAKGAAAIEETGTLILGLWANKDMRRSNVVELGTLASRNYQYEAWEIGVELTRGCSFTMLGRANHDEDEDD
jgi:uncharacterized protein YbjQ (UPF0145 family)